MIRYLLPVLMVWLCCGSAAAHDKRAKVEARAARFVQFQEWGSANAMYMLLVDYAPQEAKPYARAMVTNGLLGDDAAQVGLLEMTQKHGISLDSIFAEVHAFAYEIGESQEYAEFLKIVKERQPWMSRNINMRLLKYYDFRNDAPNMVAVAADLLVATPDDVNFLLSQGRGYMLQADYDNAVTVYKRVLKLDADNIDALLALGNYYYVMWKEAEGTRSQFTETRNLARHYLDKANALQSTPFVTAILKELAE